VYSSRQHLPFSILFSLSRTAKIQPKVPVAGASGCASALATGKLSASSGKAPHAASGDGTKATGGASNVAVLLHCVNNWAI
jgi:hypothetical protein